MESYDLKHYNSEVKKMVNWLGKLKECYPELKTECQQITTYKKSLYPEKIETFAYIECKLNDESKHLFYYYLNKEKTIFSFEIEQIDDYKGLLNICLYYGMK